MNVDEPGFWAIDIARLKVLGHEDPWNVGQNQYSYTSS